MSGYMYDDSCEMHSDVYLSEHQAALSDEAESYRVWVEAQPILITTYPVCGCVVTMYPDRVTLVNNGHTVSTPLDYYTHAEVTPETVAGSWHRAHHHLVV